MHIARRDRDGSVEMTCSQQQDQAQMMLCLFASRHVCHRETCCLHMAWQLLRKLTHNTARPQAQRVSGRGSTAYLQQGAEKARRYTGCEVRAPVGGNKREAGDCIHVGYIHIQLEQGKRLGCLLSNLAKTACVREARYVRPATAWLLAMVEWHRGQAAGPAKGTGPCSPATLVRWCVAGAHSLRVAFVLVILAC